METQELPRYETCGRMSKLKELLQDYHNGYLTTHALSRKLLAMDKRDETYGRTGDSRIRGKLKDYLRQPMDPLDILVERESQAELLEVINEIAKELPQELLDVLFYGVIMGYTHDALCERLGVSSATIYRWYDRLHGELQKYRQELSELLERPESTLEAKAPRDFIRYASGFYKEFYDGQVNRQGNYVTHCRIERYLDEAFGDDKTCCGMCEKCSNVTMRKRGNN